MIKHINQIKNKRKKKKYLKAGYFCLDCGRIIIDKDVWGVREWKYANTCRNDDNCVKWIDSIHNSYYAWFGYLDVFGIRLYRDKRTFKQKQWYKYNCLNRVVDGGVLWDKEAYVEIKEEIESWEDK